MLGVRFFHRPLPAIQGEHVFLRIPVASDYQSWARLREESRGFLEPWEPRWASDELTKQAWRERLRRYRYEARKNTGLPFFVFEKATGDLAGGLSIGNIRRGVAQTAQIGYWMGERFAGRGLMLNALNAAIPYCFDTLQLHRIEAACIPDNKRSIGLLEKAGFQREGLLRSYLKINNSWRDHYLYALIASEYPTEEKRG